MGPERMVAEKVSGLQLRWDQSIFKKKRGRVVMMFELMCFGVLLFRDCFNDAIVFVLGDIGDKLYRCQLFCRGGARSRACGHTVLAL